MKAFMEEELFKVGNTARFLMTGHMLQLEIAAVHDNTIEVFLNPEKTNFTSVPKRVCYFPLQQLEKLGLLK